MCLPDLTHRQGECCQLQVVTLWPPKMAVYQLQHGSSRGVLRAAALGKHGADGVEGVHAAHASEQRANDEEAAQCS